jgi:hypothetical protein
MILLDFYLYVYSHCLFSLQRIDIHTQANKKRKKKSERYIYLYKTNNNLSLVRIENTTEFIVFLKIGSNLFCLCVSAQDNNET